MTDTEHPDDPDEQRLEQVGEHIDAARKAAQRDGLLPEGDPDEPKFYESGSIHPELDDQTIAPPG
jgi:hypothetical protein